jgi:DNA-binding response OmpR family regulator
MRYAREKPDRERTPVSRERVLVVEDEPSIAEPLTFILERADFEVDSVSDGADALDRMRRRAYDAVILDIMLPGVNGFEVLQSVRSDRLLSALPVIVLTAKGQASDRNAAEAIGATAFITKPFSNADLVACVCSLTRAGT